VVRWMALSRDGKTVAAGGVYNTIRRWDLATARELHTEQQGHDAQVNSVAYSPDGKLLASGGENGQVWIWDAKAGKPVRTLRGTSVRSLQFSPDGQRLTMLSPGRSYSGPVVHIWDVAAWKELFRLPQNDVQAVHALSYSPDGKTLVWADGRTIQSGKERGQVISTLNVCEA